jgi:hypothetical protein
MIQKPATCSFDSTNGLSVKTADPLRLSITVAVTGPSESGPKTFEN